MTDDTSKTIPATTEPALNATPAAKAKQGQRGGKGGPAGAKTAKASKKPTQAATKATGGKTARPKAKNEAGTRKPRTGTKQEQLIVMLRRPEGATVEEAVKAFGWQAHTVRGALYGALKTKLGLDVTSEKIEGRGRVYRISN